MLRLIDADALKAWIDCGRLRPPTEMCFSEVDVVRMLDKQPTIDAEPVRHGRWEGKKWSYSCSICGGLSPEDGGVKTNYCPDCGARMDLEVQDGS